jgi:hypothetical protein
MSDENSIKKLENKIIVEKIRNPIARRANNAYSVEKFQNIGTVLQGAMVQDIKGELNSSKKRRISPPHQIHFISHYTVKIVKCIKISCVGDDGVS